MTWQRVVTIGIFVAGACVALVLHETQLANVLVGLCGGLAIPPMALPGARGKISASGTTDPDKDKEAS